MMTPKAIWGVAVILLLGGLIAGYAWGNGRGYAQGYDKAVADAKATQEELARKSAEEAAKTANPFQTQNPLEGVSANPFADARKTLNPFAQ